MRMIWTPSSAHEHRARQMRSEWAFVRAWVSILALVTRWLSHAGPGPLRRQGMRIVQDGVGGLEKVLR